MSALLKDSSDLIPFPIADSEGVWCIRHYEIENLLLIHGIAAIYRSNAAKTQSVGSIISLAQIELSKMLQLDPWSKYRDHFNMHLKRNSEQSKIIDKIDIDSEILRLCPGKQALRQVYEHIFKKDRTINSYEEFEMKLMNLVAGSPFGDTLRHALINVIRPGRAPGGIRVAEL